MNQAISKLVMQFAQIVPVVLVAWVSFGPTGSLSARTRKVDNQAAIRVGVYNDGHIDRAELYEAEHQVTTLFAEAGVKIAWLDYSHKPRRVRCQARNFSADFSLRIVFALGTLPQGPSADSLGRSMIPPSGHGYVPCGVASVYYDRVMAFALWAPQSAEILGDAMAHELGHLLLGPRHSRQGIMKALWTFRDLDLARRGKLRFSTEQLATIQRTAESLPRNSPTMAAAQR